MVPRAIDLVEELARKLPIQVRFLKDVGALSGASAASAALAVVQGLVIARWLGPAGYGTVALILAYPAFVFGLLSARSSAVWIRYLGRFSQPGDGRRAVSTVKFALLVDVGIALVTVGIVWSSSSLAERLLLDRADVAWLLSLYSLTFVPRAIRSTASAVCTVDRAFGRIASADLVGAVIRLTSVVAALYLGLGIPGVVASYVVGDLASAAILMVVAAGVLRDRWLPFRTRTGLLRDGDTVREVVRFLVVTDLTEVANVAVKRLDLLVLAYFVPSGSVGQYKLAKSVVDALGLPIAPLQSVAYQRMVELQNRPRHLGALAHRFARSVSVPGAVIALSAMLWLPPLIPWLVGSAYEAAVSLARLWILAVTARIGFFSVRPLLYALYGERQWLVAVVLGSVSFLVTSFPFTARFGVVGMTVARISFPIVAHLTGVALAARLLRARVRGGGRLGVDV